MDAQRKAHVTLARQREFPFACDPRLFSEEQYSLIKRWGFWYQGLSEGSLTPLTDAQQEFVEAALGGTPPAEPHAAAWWKYLKRLKIEQEHGDAMHSSHHEESDPFYNRDMAKQLRKTMGGVNLREHKRG